MRQSINSFPPQREKSHNYTILPQLLPTPLMLKYATNTRYNHPESIHRITNQAPTTHLTQHNPCYENHPVPAHTQEVHPLSRPNPLHPPINLIALPRIHRRHQQGHTIGPNHDARRHGVRAHGHRHGHGHLDPHGHVGRHGRHAQHTWLLLLVLVLVLGKVLQAQHLRRWSHPVRVCVVRWRQHAHAHSHSHSHAHAHAHV